MSTSKSEMRFPSIKTKLPLKPALLPSFLAFSTKGHSFCLSSLSSEVQSSDFKSLVPEQEAIFRVPPDLITAGTQYKLHNNFLVAQ